MLQLIDPRTRWSWLLRQDSDGLAYGPKLERVCAGAINRGASLAGWRRTGSDRWQDLVGIPCFATTERAEFGEGGFRTGNRRRAGAIQTPSLIWSFSRAIQKYPRKLDLKGPNYKRLSAERSSILDQDIWEAIQAASENTALVVSGKEVVADHDRFSWGPNGTRKTASDNYNLCNT
jgi:hypothetical protein